MSSLPLAIFVCGPTAVGKTAFAINLAKTLQTEIISFDARQFYRELAIGAAPPSAEELREVPHHFIGHRSVKEPWNAHQFEQAALQKLQKLLDKYHQVVLVGGSGLYMQALRRGLDPLPPAQEDHRNYWETQLREKGLASLQAALKGKDPQYYAEADVQNPRRLIRALEVMETTGQTYSQLRKRQGEQRPFRSLVLGLDMPRAQLYERINKRALTMLERGWLEEVKQLWPYRNAQALQTVGYRELFQYLEGGLSYPQAVETLQKNTRRYAKRQLTWFRHQENPHWLGPQQHAEALHLISVCL